MPQVASNCYGLWGNESTPWLICCWSGQAAGRRLVRWAKGPRCTYRRSDTRRTGRLRRRSERSYSSGGRARATLPRVVADEYVYFGESSMAALGVSRPSGRPPPEPNRVGTILDHGRPPDQEGEPAGMAEGRMLCNEFSDDAGQGEIRAMTNFPVVDTWQPPGSAARTEPAHPSAAAHRKPPPRRDQGPVR
jgi:hypothetical protein